MAHAGGRQCPRSDRPRGADARRRLADRTVRGEPPAPAHALAYRMLGSHARPTTRCRRRGCGSGATTGRSRTSVASSPPWSAACASTACAPAARPEDPVDDLTAGAALPPDPTADPLDEAILAESVGTALMVVLERLGPGRARRVRPPRRVRGALRRRRRDPRPDPDASRQLASRARRRLQGSVLADGPSTSCANARWSTRSCAPRGGDFEGLLQLLDPDVVLRPRRGRGRDGIAARDPRRGSGRHRALRRGETPRPRVVDGAAVWCGRPAVTSAASCAFTVARRADRRHRRDR